MNIEHRSDGYYIITEEKTDKNEAIVIKLNSELDNQLISCSSVHNNDVVMTNLDLTWTLKHENNDTLYIELKAKNRLKEYIERYTIDSNTCINELTSMVKNKGTLEDCEEIQKAMYKSYNKLFQVFLENDKVLHSNIIVEGVVKVKDNNKVLGHGTRFIINKDEVTVCEYTGKDVSPYIYPNLVILKGTTRINIATSENLGQNSAVFASQDDIGYLKYKVQIASQRLSHSSVMENIKYPKLKVSYVYTDKESMITYCKQNNSVNDIIKYKIALKGKVELLNIDEYMVREYLI